MWGRWALREDRDATHGYLVGVVLVDDADVLAVREPEEAEVLGFLQMAVQVVKNLTSAEERRKDCVGHSGMVGSPRSQVPECALVSPQQRETLKIALTLPNGMGCLTIYWMLKWSSSTLASLSRLEDRNDFLVVLA